MIAAIGQDVTLTQAEKLTQQQAVADAATQAKAAIDVAKNADAVDQAKADGIKAIDAQHQSGMALNERKEAAKKLIAETADKVQAAIDQDVTLTATQKAAQKQAITAEVTKANQAIDAAGNADAVDQAKNAGVKAIYDQYQSGQALADRKRDAKQAIDAEAAKETAAIDQDATLTANEKVSQKQAVADEATKAKAAIDAAKQADAVDQAKNDGIKAIDAQHHAGQAVADRKAAAKQAIDAEVAKVTGNIDQDETLTAAEKAAQKQAVATEADNAKQAIDKGQNADAVDKAKTDGIKAIDAQHQSGQAIKARQNDAKQAIDAEAAKVTKAIDQDPTLTTAEKRHRNKQSQMRQLKLKLLLMLR